MVVREIQVGQRPIGCHFRGKEDGTFGTKVLAAEIELSLVTAEATQGLQTRLRFLDLQQRLRLLNSDVIAEEVGGEQRPIGLHVMSRSN